MNKEIIDVPKGIRYIGKWSDFESIFPTVPHIMNKMITGCGFTEWCITNRWNTVLCSPRNILLDNKEEQHPGEVYRVRSEYYDREPDVDKNLNDIRSGNIDENLLQQYEQSLIDSLNSSTRKTIQELNDYISICIGGNKPIKILVTYDSFHIVKDVLIERGILEKFQIFIDEFQSVFTDSRFKADTEMGFINYLKGINRVCYLSATPMMEEYLDMMDYFSNLPYYELDWEALEKGRTKKPDLEVRVVKSIYEPVREIIEKYKSGNFETVYRTGKDGNIVAIQSREAIFYVNSVANIIRMIKGNDLQPDEVNILCASTFKNRTNISKKLGKKYHIGKVPVEGEKRKMFTFCTRTVYLGADFYSDNARSFILSDSNIECLSVDISLDLPQIMGRQRLESNPWKNWAAFYYKPLTIGSQRKIMTRADFDRFIENKLESSNKLISAWRQVQGGGEKEKLTELIDNWVRTKNYSDDYVSMNKRGGSMPYPEINNLVKIADRRAFDIQSIDYKDRFSVMNAMDINKDGVIGEINDFFMKYDNARNTYERLKTLCEEPLSDKARAIIEERVDPIIKSYLTLGKDRLKALGYNSTKINNELNIKTDENINDIIYSEFKVGDKMAKKEIKKRLQIIYDKLGMNKTSKANDLEEWFEIKEAKITINGKRENAIEIIRRQAIHSDLSDAK